jgi:hypothetical protein
VNHHGRTLPGSPFLCILPYRKDLTGRPRLGDLVPEAAARYEAGIDKVPGIFEVSILPFSGGRIVGPEVECIVEVGIFDLCSI